MINSENNSIFVDSTLKVTAREDLDIHKELATINTNNKTIEDHLKEQNAEEEKNKN